MRLPIALIASAGLTALAFGLQPAAQAAPSVMRHNSCFYLDRAVNFQQGENDRTIYVGEGGRQVFRIALENDCNIRDWDGHLLVQSSAPGPVCSPLNLRLSLVSHGIAESCMIRDIVELTPDEAASLPARYRP